MTNDQLAIGVSLLFLIAAAAAGAHRLIRHGNDLLTGRTI